jgi:hypothetical protein
VSIGTQSEEEECRGIGFKKLLNSLMLNIQRNYDFQNEGSEADALIKDGYVEKT